MLCPKKTKWVKSRLPLTLETECGLTSWKQNLRHTYSQIFLKSNYETLSSILILQRLPISKLVVMFRYTVASFRYSNTLDGSCHLLFSIFFCRTRNLIHNCSYFYNSSGYAEVNFGHLWRGSLAWHKIITQLPKCLSRGHLEFSNKAESFSPI